MEKKKTAVAARSYTIPAPSEKKAGTWSETATRVLRERYLLRDATGTIVETPDEMCWRVASAVAAAETQWTKDRATVARTAQRFYDLMIEHRFLPNSPTLMNAGKGNNLQLSACYVVPVEDSLEGIFEAVKHAALIHQSGGGTGFSFSRLRPKGSIVGSTHGVASGPVSFMKIFDGATEAVKQGGTRRGANMGVLRVDHPDIEEFIDCKRDGSVTNFNISVGVTEAFMQALENDTEYELVNPHDGIIAGTRRARAIMDKIVDAAWATGDPGLLFLDRANHSTANPIPEIERLEATNPCGEQWLGPYDACNLGSINVGLFVTRDEHGKATSVDWAALEETTNLCVRFLDDVIDINPYPLEEVRAKVTANRRIGLGIMGWAELLFELGLRYDSDEAIALGERLMTSIRDWARVASEDLAAERGAFPNWSRSIYQHDKPLRNSTRTTVAPTGSISILAECSSGIEPIFALAFQHRVKQPDGGYRVLDFVNPFFERALMASDIEDKDGVLEYVKEHGSLHGHIAEEHPALRPFVTAHEIAPDWHIRMQAAFQRGVDNSISKCLVAGTLIPTNRGLIPVEAFSGAEIADTFTDISAAGYTTPAGHRILSHYVAGEKPATRIRLDNGSDLIGATESHRVMTPDGWRLMSELRPGDLVTGKRAESHGPGAASLPSLGAFATNANKVRAPERMSPALALFLGMVAADGFVTESSGAVGVVSVDEAVLREFHGLCEQLFGQAPHLYEDPRNSVRTLTITSRALARWVRDQIGAGAYYKRVPAEILAGSAEEKLEFLRGVSLDGYYRPRHGLYIYSGMSRELAYGVAEVCRSFGMPLVRQEQTTVAETGVIIHRVIVSNDLQELVRAFEDHKNGPRHDAEYQVLIDQDRLASLATTYRDPHHHTVSKMRERGAGTCTNRVARALGWPEVIAHRVTLVEDAGVLPLYDVEVEDAHEYVVNGMVSHNTVNLNHEATREDVLQAYMQAWNLGCLGITIFRDGSKGEQVLNVGVKEEKKAEEATATRDAPAINHRYSGGIKDRPEVVHGYTRQVRAPEGKVNITLNSDEDGLLEIFVNVGKAGSDIAALAEAVGRLASLNLRLDSPLSQNERAREIARQLKSIGGSASVGFGIQRVRSLPDAVARSIDQHFAGELGEQGGVGQEASGNGAGGHANGGSGGNGAPGLNPMMMAQYTVSGNLCSHCGNNTMIYEEGCKKCASCGHSEC